MKIVFFYKFVPDYHFDHFLHLDFVRSFNKYNPEHKAIAYGERVQEAYLDIAPIEYKRTKTMGEIHKEFEFDVFIPMTKSRCFDYYCPARYPYKEEVRRGCNLPPDFNNYNCPKIMLDEDTHYETDLSWYHEMGFDYLFQRHYGNFKKFENDEMKNIWFPFSVDTEIFKPNTSKKRLNRIAFAGNSTHEIYKWRKGAVTLLQKQNLADCFDAQKKEQAYIECLQEYKSHISCSSIYNISPAKMFEILASGSILFTNESDKYGIQHLFPDNSYVTYKEDFSDVIEKAHFILNNSHESMIESALDCIKNKHSNEIRSRELIDFITNTFNIK